MAARYIVMSFNKNKKRALNQRYGNKNEVHTEFLEETIISIEVNCDEEHEIPTRYFHEKIYELKRIDNQQIQNLTKKQSMDEHREFP